MNLTKQQQAVALAGLCSTYDSKKSLCTARAVFGAECPFRTNNCKVITERNWRAILDTEPDGPLEAATYAVTVDVQVTTKRRVTAITSQAAENRAGTDVINLMHEAGFNRGVRVVVKNCEKENE